ncbi:hypothetical protein J7J26_02595 [Candidatus Micrarchaeota archaeon]|nr:hypothetical protein [Candidatus Micrarchaeota archaeon]
MPIMRCERCSKPTYYLTTCTYCGRKICSDCVKSSRIAKKGEGLRVICKDCWTDVKKRKEYKS